MKYNEPLLLRCRHLVEAKLGWGDSQHWTNADFEALSETILSETGISLSTSTLKRIWGKVKYASVPQAATLNALAQFAGYQSFRAFEAASKEEVAQTTADVATWAEAPDLREIPTAATLRKRPVSSTVIWSVGLFISLFLSLLIVFALRTPPQSDTVTDPARYAFSSRPVATGIPNSVVFNFDVSPAKTDCLAIQQSWDPTQRFKVKKNQHQATSIYYYPGFFKAKLLVNRRVVKEHNLLIPTSGWLALIDQKPVPVYLPNDGIISDTVMRVPLSVIRANHIALQPNPPQVNYFNVRDFGPVKTDDFDFVTQVRNEYREGAAVCQQTGIVLMTEGSAIVIPLSGKGCVSDLTLLSIDRQLSGKQTDLSAFGVDFADWVTVRCRGDAHFIRFYVNGQLAYQLPAPRAASHIVGIGYGFQGTGAVRGVVLKAGGKVVYQAF